MSIFISGIPWTIVFLYESSLGPSRTPSSQCHEATVWSTASQSADCDLQRCSLAEAQRYAVKLLETPQHKRHLDDATKNLN
jgi:hypothetical protein